MPACADLSAGLAAFPAADCAEWAARCGEGGSRSVVKGEVRCICLVVF